MGGASSSSDGGVRKFSRKFSSLLSSGNSSRGYSGGEFFGSNDDIRLKEIPYSNERGSIVCISFSASNHVRLIYGSRLLNVVESSIKRWMKCSRLDHGGAVCWKLNGEPFREFSKKNIIVRKMTMDLLRSMLMHGYKIETASSISRREIPMSSVFFSSDVREEDRTIDTEFLCLYLDNTNRLTMICGDSVHPNSCDDILHAISESCRGIFGTNFRKIEKEAHVVYEFVLPPSLWVSQLPREVCQFMVEILGNLNMIGFRVYCSLFQSQRNSLSTLYFTRQNIEHVKVEKTEFCCLSTSGEDVLELINTIDRSTAKEISKAIKLGGYESTIDRTNVDRENIVVEYLINNTPWLGDEKCKRLMCRLLEGMGRSGWKLNSTMCLIRNITSKDTFFFERPMSENATEPDHHPVACISLKNLDALNLIDAPPDLVETISKAVKSNWQKGSIMRRTRRSNEVEFRLNGSPWYAEERDFIYCCSLMAHILAAAQTCGWDVCSSAKVTNISPLHTWFLRSTATVANTLDNIDDRERYDLVEAKEYNKANKTNRKKYHY